MDDATDIDDQPRTGSAMPIVAITAIVLSVCALLVSVFEVSAIRDEQRIQVWPYVDISTRYGPDGFAIIARNKGIGPARVRTLKLVHDDREVTDLDQLILSILGPERAFSYDVYSTSNPARSVLSPGDEVNVFAVPWTESTRALVKKMSPDFTVELCYCSVYDECWLGRLNEGEPAPVDGCPQR